MPVRRPQDWWRKTLAGSAAAAALLGLALPVGGVLASRAPGPAWFGLGLAEFAAVVLLPFALALAVRFHAVWQDRVDRAFSVNEDA